MEYNYGYPMQYPPMRGPDEGIYPDHGDGYGDYYGGAVDENIDRRPSTKYDNRRPRKHSRSRNSTTSKSHSRSKSRSRSRSRSKSRARSRSQSRSLSRSHTASRHRDLRFREPKFLDAFRVLYLSPCKQKKSTTKYLVTKKRQDRIQEILKSDGLGSKKWFFYPRNNGTHSEPPAGDVPGSRDNCDQRVKVDGDFFRKYKKRKKTESIENTPIAKLKRWELMLYKKIGFLQAI